MTVAELVGMFAERRPVAVMAQSVLERLLEPAAIDRLFHDTAERQYERELLFSSLARLMSEVVLCRAKSVRAAYRKVQAEIGVSLTATYAKLERIEPELSQALVRYSYGELARITNELRSYEPSPVAGLRPKILDGNQFAATEHRLLETRRSTAAPLPGKALVVLDPRREAIADLFPIADGHAQERTWLDPVIATIERNDLWIADRNFCTLKFLYSLARCGARFVVRLHAQLHGEPLGKRRFIGKTATGRCYEAKLRLPEFDGETLTVRAVESELFRPTRDGDETLVILTNLTAAEADALRVTEIYRGRWRIETAFQKLTTELRCELCTLCYPKAAIFTFALACLAYNAVSSVLAVIRAEHGREEAEQLSFHTLGTEIAQTYDGLMVAIPATYWRHLRELPQSEFIAGLRATARLMDLSYYRKVRRRPRKPKPKPAHDPKKVHVSTQRILDRRKQ